jgi:hypothetical protein
VYKRANNSGDNDDEDFISAHLNGVDDGLIDPTSVEEVE